MGRRRCTNSRSATRSRSANHAICCRSRRTATHHILIAAGIGITPMLSMARYMDVHGISFELHYFARTEEDAAFLPLLRDRCPEKLHAHVGVAARGPGASAGGCARAAPLRHSRVLCGPEGFMTKSVAIAERYHAGSKRALRELPRVGTARRVREHAHSKWNWTARRTTCPPTQKHRRGARGERMRRRHLVSGGDLRDLHHAGTPGRARASRQRADPAERESGEVIAVCVSRTRDDRLVLDYY